MSRNILNTAVLRSGARAAIAIATLAVAAAPAGAQAALGTPFIGKNLFSFHTAQNTRSGGAATTQTFGAIYGHRFGASDATSNVNLVVRFSARPLEGVDSGVLDLAATVGGSQAVPGVPNLSFAASTGAGLMAWSDDGAKTGRVMMQIPANAGLSYAIKMGSATLSPFAMGTLARYDLRTSLNDVQLTRERGWDTYYTSGASLKLREVVLTSSVTSGEHGMPNKSRWSFSAGVSF